MPHLRAGIPETTMGNFTCLRLNYGPPGQIHQHSRRYFNWQVWGFVNNSDHQQAAQSSPVHENKWRREGRPSEAQLVLVLMIGAKSNCHNWSWNLTGAIWLISSEKWSEWGQHALISSGKLWLNNYLWFVENYRACVQLHNAQVTPCICLSHHQSESRLQSKIDFRRNQKICNIVCDTDQIVFPFC